MDIVTLSLCSFLVYIPSHCAFTISFQWMLFIGSDKFFEFDSCEILTEFPNEFVLHVLLKRRMAKYNV